MPSQFEEYVDKATRGMRNLCHAVNVDYDELMIRTEAGEDLWAAILSLRSGRAVEDIPREARDALKSRFYMFLWGA